MQICPVCLESYNLTTRRSLIICTNGHSLCKICQEGARDMRCPTCREQMLTTPIPNRFMQDLILSDTTSRGEQSSSTPSSEIEMHGQSIRCERDHLLSRRRGMPFTYSSPTVFCNLCRKVDLEHERYFHHCGVCEYDVCLRCSISQDPVEEIRQMTMVICDKKHNMTQCIGKPPEYTESPHVFCNVCDKDFLENDDYFLHCRECGYDICAECTTALI